MKKHFLGVRMAYAAVYVGAVALLGLFVGSGAIRCPFAMVTHMPCPGCGSTRAVRAALALHFGDALRYNPMAPIIAACMLVLAVEGLVRILRDGHLRDLASGRVGPWALRILATSVALQIPIWCLRFFGLFGGPVAV